MYTLAYRPNETSTWYSIVCTPYEGNQALEQEDWEPSAKAKLKLIMAEQNNVGVWKKLVRFAIRFKSFLHPPPLRREACGFSRHQRRVCIQVFFLNYDCPILDYGLKIKPDLAGLGWKNSHAYPLRSILMILMNTSSTLGSGRSIKARLHGNVSCLFLLYKGKNMSAITIVNR